MQVYSGILCEIDTTKNNKECPESGCMSPMSYTDAEQYCRDIGARLCTLPEINNGEAVDGTCYDDKYVWSSTPCNHACTDDRYQVANSEGYYATWGGGWYNATSSNGFEKCIDPTRQDIGVKCCSEASDYRSGDEILVYDDQSGCRNVNTDGWTTDLKKLFATTVISHIAPSRKMAINTGLVNEGRYGRDQTGCTIISPEGCRIVHGPFAGSYDRYGGQSNPFPPAHSNSYVMKTISGLGTSTKKFIRITLRYYAVDTWDNSNSRYYESPRGHWSWWWWGPAQDMGPQSQPYGGEAAYVKYRHPNSRW